MGAACSEGEDGRPKMSLVRSLDHMRKLTAQFPLSPTRVVYAASGTLPSAVIVTDASSIVEHACYWAPAHSIDEARYLVAILNSDTARARGAAMQPRGQGGARHFDNLIWELPIPEFDRNKPLHRNLAAAAIFAEQVAAAVALPEGADFRTSRHQVRAALLADGIAARIDALVASLIGG